MLTSNPQQLIGLVLLGIAAFLFFRNKSAAPAPQLSSEKPKSIFAPNTRESRPSTTRRDAMLEMESLIAYLESQGNTAGAAHVKQALVSLFESNQPPQPPAS